MNQLVRFFNISLILFGFGAGVVAAGRLLDGQPALDWVGFAALCWYAATAK